VTQEISQERDAVPTEPEKHSCGCDPVSAMISYLRPDTTVRVEFVGCRKHCAEFWNAMSAPLRETAIIKSLA